jgi:DNA polymerase-3 subunit gamma/tau
MSNFVVSARKYRPNRFEDVVGQAHVSLTLKNALRNDHLAHAFLFCGPRGVGKTTCARILAKVLNCQNLNDSFEPCNTCDSCQSFNENASFNITELDAASNNSVEHIRALIEQVRFQPQQGKYKVFIIDEVHMLSQQAFNAFLKTLEEPPSYAIFILATTEKHKIIPTILSRCQIFDFKRIQVQDMVAHLQHICVEEGIEAEPDALNIIGQKADGALRDALSIFDRIVSFSGKQIKYEDVISNLNILDYDYFFKVVDALLMEDVSKMLLIFDDILKKGFDPDLFINGLASHLRNLLVCKDPQTIPLLEGSDSLKQRYGNQANLAPFTFLLTALNLCNDCDINYKMARNKRLHVEMTLIKMTYINRAVSAVEMPSRQEEKKTPDLSKEAPSAAIEHDPPSPAAKKPLAADSSGGIVQQKETNNPKAQPLAKKGSPLPTNHTKAKLPATNKFSVQKVDMNAMLEDLKNGAEEKVEALELSQEELQIAWDEYLAKAPDSVKAIMRATDFKISGDTIIALVSSKLAENTIRQESALMEHLRKHFRRPSIVLQIEIDKSKILELPKPKKILTPKEKYLKMAEGNALVHEIRKRFDLRPDDD